MTDKHKQSSGSRQLDAARSTRVAAPNPQGKGQIGFLQDWDYSTPRGIVVKQDAQVLADYFTSLLVLSAAFKFKPVFNKDYYLYWDESQWALSLISPDEWNTVAKRRSFVGTCVLHDDSTWSIEPSENLAEGGPVAAAIAVFYNGFVDRLQSESALEDELPVYEAGLDYYQRIFAAALGRSLKVSLVQGGQLNTPSTDWLTRMPGTAERLLAPPDPNRR